MTEHTTSRYERRQNRISAAEENELFWDKLKADKTYTAHEYDSSIFSDTDYTESELERNTSWHYASELVYNMEHGDNAWRDLRDENNWSDEKSRAEIDEWGLGYMGRFNYNMVIMGANAAQVASDETSMDEKIAFKYMMDAYEHKSMSLAGWGRAIAGMSYDPSSYVGLATLGAATIGAQGVKAGIKMTLAQGIKESIATTAGHDVVKVAMAIGMKNTTRSSALIGSTAMGVEGSFYSYKDDENRQQVDITVGAQKDWDYDRSAQAAGFGFVLGKSLGIAIPYAVRNTGGWARNTKEFAGTRSGKVITATAAMGTPVAAIAASRNSDEQEQERLDKTSKSVEDAIDDHYSDEIRSRLISSEDSKPEPITGKFTSSADHFTRNNSAQSQYTSTATNPLAIAFHNQVYGLEIRPDQPIISLYIAPDEALEIQRSFKS